MGDDKLPKWKVFVDGLDAIINHEQINAELRHELIVNGLLSNEEVKKPCPSCGQLRADYYYDRITAAGRVFIKAVAALTPKEDNHA